MKKQQHKCIVVVGPTASGKTSLSEVLAESIDGEIINADVGQFYSPLSVGTAKPTWKNYPFKCHLFDIIDQPEDLDIADYRSRVTGVIADITARGKIPIIVGGSLFYLKALFFLPFDFSSYKQIGRNNHEASIVDEDREKLWDQLYTIDPERAVVIHKNDVYRIKRALEIWEQSGVKPSTCKPTFDPVIDPLFINLDLPKVTIDQRIDARTELMLSSGWLSEAESLMGSDWETFLRRKKLIGYAEIFEWEGRGKQNTELADLSKTIKTETKRYAKRQKTFWNGLCRELKSQLDDFEHKVITLANEPTQADLCNVINSALEFIKNSLASN